MVTGGAGFIGSNFVRYLLNETNSKVINLDKLTYAGNLRNIRDLRPEKRHRFVKGDIRNRRLVDSLVGKHHQKHDHDASYIIVARTHDVTLVMEDTKLARAASRYAKTAAGKDVI